MTDPKSAALSLGLSALILYLAAHAVTGRQGLISYMDLQQQERSLTAERDSLAAERIALEARVHRLASDSLDLDALDEEARRQLGAAHPDEIIFKLAQSGDASAQ